MDENVDLDEDQLPVKQERTIYPEDFNQLWKCFAYTQKAGLGNRGIKGEAYAEWKKIKNPPVNDMIDALRKQAKEKLACKKKRQDWDYFKHACRWLKWKAWEGDEDLDDIVTVEEAGSIDQSVIDRLTDRSWSE